MYLLRRYSVVAYFFVFSAVNFCSCQPPVPGSLVEVTLEEGVVRGREKTAPGGGTYFSFTGIPYASAPVGPFRFKAPSPPAKWNGVLDTSMRSVPECMQFNLFTKQVVGVEDCLVVNVFTPADLRSANRKNLPVMVWIHGGGYVQGSSKPDMFGPGHFVARGVIMVSLNYRLAALGFLSTEDAISPGNYGILDQIEALKWVQRNIAAFGGDPNRVTIFGVSAGGASVHNLVLTPQARGLFRNAISQSGTSLCPWAFEENSLGNAKKLAEMLDCPTDSNKKMMHCLRTAPGRAVVEAAGSFHEWFLLPLSFGPVVDSKMSDEPVFPRAPVDLLATGDFNRVPWINGIAKDDGYCMSFPAYFNSSLAVELDSKWDQYCPLLLDIQNTVAQDKLADTCDKTRKHYFGDGKISENLSMLTQLLGDRGFLGCAKFAAQLQSRFSPVYLYSLEYEGKLGWFDLIIAATKFAGNSEGLNLDKPKGVAHADDMLYMFHMDLFATIERPEADKKFLARFMDLWTNFAKFDEPTPEDVDGEIRWPKFDQRSQPQHYVLDGNPAKLATGLVKEEDDAFWRTLPIEENIPKLWEKEEL